MRRREFSSTASSRNNRLWVCKSCDWRGQNPGRREHVYRVHDLGKDGILRPVYRWINACPSCTREVEQA